MKKHILSTFHHSFAGGSKNTSRLLHHLAKNDSYVDTFFFEEPQYFSYTKSKVKTHTLPAKSIHSDVINYNALANYALADKILTELDKIENPILFGANLFPYCNILHDVKSQSKKNAKLIIMPVGSDIWQLGSQFKSRLKWLLNSKQVDTIITYSNSFISEIKDYFDIDRNISILPPVLEKEKFHPITTAEKSKRRKLMGLSDDDFIIHHHSSMRPIKCPEITLEIVMLTAQLVKRHCVLIMAGPIPFEVIKMLNLDLVMINRDNHLKYKSVKENLTIYWTGVLTDVEFLMPLSDLELNTSLHDSFNISLMEAMACSLPVVTSDVVGIGEHINKSDSGFCFPTKKLKFDELNQIIDIGKTKKSVFNIDDAVDMICNLSKNETLANVMGEKGAKYVVNEFCIDRISQQFLKHLD